MTKHFSITIAAENVLENVSKRQRSRFVSDAIMAFAKKKDIFDNYNIDTTSTSTNKNKVVSSSNKSSDSVPQNNSQAVETGTNKIEFDEDF